MRYEVRFNNQVYHVFDTLNYEAVQAFELEAEATARVEKLNK